MPQRRGKYAPGGNPYNKDNQPLKASVEMTTRLPDGSLLTESYRYKKMPRNP
jgi:hypothetical protein